MKKKTKETEAAAFPNAEQLTEAAAPGTDGTRNSPEEDIFATAEEEQRKAEEKQRKKEKKERDNALRKIRKADKKLRPKEYRTFSVTKNFVFYLCFLVFAFIFTQALRSTLSSELFIFALLLPWVMVLYVLTGFLSLRDSNEIETETTQKEAPVGYEILLSNDGFLPYPYVEADVRYPSADGVRCDCRRVGFSLAPYGVYRIEDKAVFHYRGSYEIGVQDIYVYDLLKFFRIRLRQENLRPVFVMPRRIAVVLEGEGSASEINTTEVRNLRGADRTELTEIKEYQTGDGLRDIHWKLSSKTQDLMVKHYGMNACRSVYYLPDLGEGYTDPLQKGLYDPDINLYCADAVTEMTIGLMLAALRADNNICTLLWYDRRAEGLTALPAESEKKRADDTPQMSYAAEVMYNETDFERVYPFFATAGLHDASLRPATLCRFITETESVSYYIVTSRLDAGILHVLQENLRDYSGAVLNGGIELYYFNPAKKIRDPETRRAHDDSDEQIIAQLRASGILVRCFDSL